ncbi:MAG TPA: hypothetical protein VMU54_11445 [Planctomycetota bacterium]|nr:hypothetical protein [Planctomycetota bacterium]
MLCLVRPFPAAGIGLFLPLMLAILLLHLFLRGHWRSDWNRRRIRRAFQEMDSLDGREATAPEYESALRELRHGLPGWAAIYALERLGNSDCPSRRRHLEILSQSDVSPFRERLVDLARDSTDPLAAEIWELLTGRHRSLWTKALLETDGKSGFADPGLPPSGAWCGYYVQLGAQHRMEFTLQFHGKTFSGEGRDIVGAFTLSGETRDADVQAVKGYPHHAVHYEGRFDGDGIAGRWSLVGGSGEFRMWPRRQAVPQPPSSKV